MLGSGGIILDCDTIPYIGEDQNYIYNGDTMADCVVQLDEAVSNKQDTLVSGTNIKTVNNNSLLGSGNITLNDADIPYDGNAANVLEDATNVQEALDLLDDAVSNINPNEITSITTSESSASGGNNSVTITESNGTTHTFNVKNGVDGQNGVSLGDVAIADDLETDDATKVLSAKQGKRIGDDLSRLKDYEFGEATYDKDDLFKNKSYTNNTATITGKMVNLNNYGCLMLTVTKGDKVTIASYGASGPRTYSLCDNDYNVYKVAASGYDCTSNPVTIEVMKDGYCHINCRSAAYSAFAVTHYYSTERKMLDDNTRSLTSGEMDGTSRWIVDKLQALGWEYNMKVHTNGTTTVAGGYVASPFIPCDNIAGHSITFCYMHNYGSGNIALYNENKAFTTNHYFATTDVNKRTVDINAGWTADRFIRMTCNPDKLAECYIYDNTDEVYIWKGDEYLSAIYEDNLVSYKTFRDVLVLQESGKSELKTMSQKAINEYARKALTEDLEGLSDWVRGKMEAKGWQFKKYLNSNGAVGASSSIQWTCVSPFFPCTTGTYTWQPRKPADLSGNPYFCFYGEDGTYKENMWTATINGTATKTVTNDTITQFRFTCNMNDLPNVYVETGRGEPIFKGDDYLAEICKDCAVSYGSLKNTVDDVEELKTIGRRAFGTTSVFNANVGAILSRSEKQYNLSSKPWVDVVYYNVAIGSGGQQRFFGFCPTKTENPQQAYDYIGFTTNTWSTNFIIRRDNVEVHKTTSAIANITTGMVVGVRFDFRRKTLLWMIRRTSGVLDSGTIDLSAYDLDLGKCFLYSGFGYCSYVADQYVGWNNLTNMSDFSAFFTSPLTVGKFKVVDEYTYPSDDIDGSVFRGFTKLMTEWSPTQDENGHWVASVDLSDFTYVTVECQSFPSTHYLYNNWDLMVYVGKIKASNGSIQMKASQHVKLKDVYDITDSVYLTGNDGVYTIQDGHTVEFRIRNGINGKTRPISFMGTCTLEMWDWEIHVAMNTNLTPSNYDGTKIFGGMNFLFDKPNKVTDIPLVVSSNYYAQGIMKYSSNKLYARVYDTSTNTYVDKQISNT